MKILWNTEIFNKENELVFIEKLKPNLIMNFAAAMYLHRLSQPISPNIYDLLKFVSLGSSSLSPNSPTEEIMVNEIDRVLIGSNFRYENSNTDSIGNVLAVEYSYENSTGVDIIINERGLVSGGVEYTDPLWTGDWADRSQTGYLFSRKVETVPLTVPDGGTIYGSIKITTDIF